MVFNRVDGALVEDERRPDCGFHGHDEHRTVRDDNSETCNLSGNPTNAYRNRRKLSHTTALGRTGRQSRVHLLGFELQGTWRLELRHTTKR